jgi:acetoin:2,6-dichlorophenolindophenol oxidoreductase subunit alpha
MDVVESYRRMVRTRRFEEAAVRLHRQGEIPGAIHTSIGQEATTVGACMALRHDDFMTGNHRSHGHPIAKGAPLGPLMAELLGRATGVCRGKGGSMHLADFSVGSVGESAIVGGGIPIATGAGLSAQIRGTDQVSLCFFGDGAANQGTFHESVNMAAIWRLPVIYLCENNRYGATTPFSSATSVTEIAQRAASYAIPGVTVDGQDLVAVYDAVDQAVTRARRGDGPSIVEANTYRFREHAEGLRLSNYRTEAEVEEWIARDPIALFRERLLADQLASQQQLDVVDAEVGDEVERAVTFALESPFPEPSDAFRDVFAAAAVER